MSTAERVRSPSWKGSGERLITKHSARETRVPEKNWGVTAFSKQLAVVMRVEQTGRLADLLQEKGYYYGDRRD